MTTTYLALLIILLQMIIFVLLKIIFTKKKRNRTKKNTQPQLPIGEPINIPTVQQLMAPQEEKQKPRAQVIHRPSAQRLVLLHNPQKKELMDYLSEELEKNPEIKKLKEKRENSHV